MLRAPESLVATLGTALPAVAAPRRVDAAYAAGSRDNISLKRRARAAVPQRGRDRPPDQARRDREDLCTRPDATDRRGEDRDSSGTVAHICEAPVLLRAYVAMLRVAASRNRPASLGRATLETVACICETPSFWQMHATVSEKSRSAPRVGCVSASAKPSFRS
jgi:hypothetical protein